MYARAARAHTPPGRVCVSPTALEREGQRTTTERRSSVGVNKSTLGVNNVTTCLQRLVVYSPVSPIAARSHRIVCTRRKGSVLDVVCAHSGTAHSAVAFGGKWHAPTKNTG